MRNPRNFITVVLLAILVLPLAGCGGEEQKAGAEINTSEVATNIEKHADVDVLKEDILEQQSDYARLFDREPKNCDFISSEILATALQVSREIIEELDVACTYNLLEPNGNKTRFHFAVETWGNKRVLSEIKRAKKNAKQFGKNSTLSQLRISETGDTYLSMHQNRMIRILNEAKGTVIVLLYYPQIEPEETDNKKRAALKDEARQRAYAISNFLLKRYQEK